MERWEELVLNLERRANQHREQFKRLEEQIEALSRQRDHEDRRAQLAESTAQYLRLVMNDTPDAEIPW